MNWPIFFIVVFIVGILMYGVARDQEGQRKCTDAGGEVVKTFRSWECIGDRPREP